MSAAQPNYYDTLGLSPSATSEEIKKRYRELARRYHPDVNPSAEASQKIKLINEAYHVLGDPDRRAYYDAERLLRQNAAARAAGSPSAAPSAPPRAERAPGPARPTYPEGRASFNGFGRTPPEPPAPTVNQTRRPAAAPNSPTHAANRRAASTYGNVERMLSEAQLAFINHRYREAEKLCHEVLLRDRRHAVAYEILGDICARRGQQDGAATWYSYAIQFNPRNYKVQAKLERLMGGRTHVSAGPTMTRPTMPTWQPFAEGPRRETNLALLSVILVAAFFGMMLLFWEHQGVPAFSFQNSLPLISDLSLHLLAAMVFDGVLAGILLAFYGAMRPISEELLARNQTAEGKQSAISLGSILILFSVVWFYLSLIVYMGIAVARNRISPSILRAYATTVILTGIFAGLYNPTGAPNGWIQAAIFGGNAVFPSVLLGWAIGDAIRLQRR
ncbi:MAG TPA: DnaJ domain-containing protein [Chthonomonadaceae bacterium]|nr:DnaJ domain-containing protein [Chthonomonadaceae bacterium]